MLVGFSDVIAKPGHARKNSGILMGEGNLGHRRQNSGALVLDDCSLRDRKFRGEGNERNKSYAKSPTVNSQSSDDSNGCGDYFRRVRSTEIQARPQIQYTNFSPNFQGGGPKPQHGLTGRTMPKSQTRPNLHPKSIFLPYLINNKALRIMMETLVDFYQASLVA
jgi:hypothetical protein